VTAWRPTWERRIEAMETMTGVARSLWSALRTGGRALWLFAEFQMMLVLELWDWAVAKMESPVVRAVVLVPTALAVWLSWSWWWTARRVEKLSSRARHPSSGPQTNA
jgi:hypothetical protein